MLSPGAIRGGLIIVGESHSGDLLLSRTSDLSKISRIAQIHLIPIISLNYYQARYVINIMHLFCKCKQLIIIHVEPICLATPEIALPKCSSSAPPQHLNLISSEFCT